jgi:ferrous iron transport protein B
MELPGVLCLNMMDEADQRGIGVDHGALGKQLGIDVVPTVAVRHEGVARLRSSIESARTGEHRVEYPAAVERAVAETLRLLPEASIAPRALALMILSGDETLVPWLAERATPEALAAIETIRQRLRRELADPVPLVVSRARQRAAAALAVVVARRTASATPQRAIAVHLERLATDPIWGLPILALVLLATYLFVGVFGAGDLVELLEGRLFGELINPAAIALTERFVGWAFLRDLLVGPYGLVTMALTYSLALVLPIVGTFFIAFGLLEDSGYLPRLAVMANRLFRKMGLNGKAILPMVLGLGCDTMATLTTRVLETSKERLIVILLLALAVPCSAQLSVILVMLSPLPPTAFVIWLSVVLAVIFFVGRLANRLLPGRGGDFVLELPPLRAPRLGNILVKTVARIEWYLREAVPLFVLGALVLFALDRLGLLGLLETLAAPVLSGLLGLPAETAPAFVIGFLRRDFGAAGLFELVRQGRMDVIQTVVAAVTVTLFLPCIANLLMIVKERGWRTALAVISFVLPFALAVGAVLNGLLRLLRLL